MVRISPQLVGAYKAIRLAALITDPLCFGSTYEREALFPDSEWERRASSLDGQDRVGFLALKNGEPCGLVLCFRDNNQQAIAEVISMWVAPLERRSGLGSKLLQTVRLWAEIQGVETLRLLVTSCNAAGVALYERNGFVLTGKKKSYPHLPDAWEIEMNRPVATL